MSLMVEQMLDLARGSQPSGRGARGDGFPGPRRSRQRHRRTDPGAARQKGVRLALDADATASIRGSEHTLQRAIGNLLENALT